MEILFIYPSIYAVTFLSPMLLFLRRQCVFDRKLPGMKPRIFLLGTREKKDASRVKRRFF